MPDRLLEPEHRGALVVTIVCCLVFFMAVAAGGGAIFSGIRSQKETNKAICLALNRENGYIHSAILRGEKTLPTLSYYKSHPRELGEQLAELRQEEIQFRPVHC